MANLSTIIALCLTYLSLLPTPTSAARKPPNAILLSKVKTLTLHGDQKTTARRSSAVPQLKCVGGSGKGYYDVDVMRCSNQGSEYDAEDIQWTCQASLPPEFKLGSTDVVCEGYDGSEDPYVLKGSCGVEYRLVLTNAGEEKYGKGWVDGGSGFGEGGLKTVGERVWTGMFWVIFIGIVVIIIYSALMGGGGQANANIGRRQGWGGGGGGGGGGDDGHDDPPPPYSPRSPPRSKNTAYGSRPGEAWRPGFWTGAAAGGAAGYAMGNRNQTRYNQATQAGPSNWFGGGGGGGGGSYGSPSPSSSRHESTGFGGTRRR